jgi:rod shape-determining protein MreC
MFKRPHYIALTVVLLLVLIILSLPNSTATQLKLALGGFFLPLFGLAGSTQALTERAGYSLLPRSSLVNQLEQLQRENQQLRLQTMQSAQVWQENTRLREALGWQQQSHWKLKHARVILRDPANWWRTFQIDLGQRDGIATNMPVLTAEGLVGKISQVGYSSSQVALIGDPNCRAAITIRESPQDKNPIPGLILGGSASVSDPTIVNLTSLERQSAIKPGMTVLTSGLGGVFPPEIPVGHVIDTNIVWFGVNTEARVKLSANLKHLEEVWVKFP